MTNKSTSEWYKQEGLLGIPMESYNIKTLVNKV